MNEKTKRICLNVLWWLLTLVVIAVVIYGVKHRDISNADYENADNASLSNEALDVLHLEAAPKIQVDIADVLVSEHEEMRKLIVSEQTVSVSTVLSERVIQSWDIKALTKSQKVTYEGKGRFLVDLDDLGEKFVVQDDDNKTVTIKIRHAYLESVEIDPYKIKAEEVEEGFFARGDIKMSVAAYNELEKKLQDLMRDKLNTIKNGQQADEIALRMVKEIYEPIVKAIDEDYSVVVEFR